MNAPETKLGFDGTNVSFSLVEKNDAGNELVSNKTDIALVAIVEAIVKATPTKVDDAALPYVEMLIKLMPKAQA